MPIFQNFLARFYFVLFCFVCLFVFFFLLFKFFVGENKYSGLGIPENKFSGQA